MNFRDAEANAEVVRRLTMKSHGPLSPEVLVKILDPLPAAIKFRQRQPPWRLYRASVRTL